MDNIYAQTFRSLEQFDILEIYFDTYRLAKLSSSGNGGWAA